MNKALDKRFIKQARSVNHFPINYIALLHQAEFKVKLGNDLMIADGLQINTGNGGLPIDSHVLQRKQYLEKWRMEHIPLTDQFIHQTLKGHVLMGVCIQGFLLNLSQEFRKGGLKIQLAPQHQSIDKKTDQRLDFFEVTVCNGAAHRDIRLAGVFGEQHHVSGQRCHVQTDTLLFAKTVQFLGQQRIQLERKHVTGKAGVHGAWLVGG